ncbi:MAG: hypothetical protein N2559_01740 [Anaerolineae bacterium]|nr:hypothetical protein [Anaerolineae bacterium]
MNNLTDWAAGILETDEEILVPVKKLWVQYTAQNPGISLDDFTRALEADARFEFMEGTDLEEGLEDWTEEERAEHVAEMEALGFFGGPRVKLVSREITREHVARMIAKHTNNMLNALWSAYDVRPEDLDPEEDAELLDLIARAKELQLNLREILELPPEDQEQKPSE